MITPRGTTRGTFRAPEDAQEMLLLEQLASSPLKPFASHGDPESEHLLSDHIQTEFPFFLLSVLDFYPKNKTAPLEG